MLHFHRFFDVGGGGGIETCCRLWIREGVGRGSGERVRIFKHEQGTALADTFDFIFLFLISTVDFIVLIIMCDYFVFVYTCEYYSD